mgnify:CR=1 FL=1
MTALLDIEGELILERDGIEALRIEASGHLVSAQIYRATTAIGLARSLLGLVRYDEATHIAIRDGEWFDPATWYNGEIPGDDAKVLIPEGIAVGYGEISDERIFTIRVDGKLDFASDADSRIVFDTGAGEGVVSVAWIADQGEEEAEA